MKVVVTMTSWKKRIEYVADMIEYFFKTQTELPDVFYLWLAIPEFPNKENDLPKKLLEVIKRYDVNLQWVKENTKGFKRWKIYPKHYNDIVVSIDDDIYFDSKLISTAKKFIFPNKIVISLFKSLSELKISSNGIDFQKTTENKPLLNRRFLCCSIIPPNSFPLEALNKENSKILSDICLNYDEFFMLPFMIKNNIKNWFYPFNNKFDNEINTTESVFSQIKDCANINGFKIQKRMLFLYIVFRFNNELKQSWIDNFKDYKKATKAIENYSTEYLIEKLNDS